MAKHDDIPTTSPAEIEALIERVKQSQLAPRDAQLVERLLRLVLSMATLLQQKNASIKRLKRLLFGPRSDKRTVQPAAAEDKTKDQAAAHKTEGLSAAFPSSTSETEQAALAQQRPRRKGHGRMGAAAYTGAQVVLCRHATLKPGDKCLDPFCHGQLYDTNAPTIFVQLTGQPIVGATSYQRQVLRCSTCQERFTAALPAGVSEQKYDATADVALVLAKFAGGVPYYRLARLQASCGVPLPESVQFERCENVANAALPVFLRLQKLAADGVVLYGDDTRVKILDCLKENAELAAAERHGLQTSGIVVEVGGPKIALYGSGRPHTGERLAELLKQRSAGLDPPIQMGDALAANWSGEPKTIAAKCLTHGRRKFVELEEQFPPECARVLAAIGKVYGFEAETAGLSAAERLAYHQQHSGPVLAELREWIDEQFRTHAVEPNSGLGQALRYLTKHWSGLTKFLSVAGAPLDNNLAERALKRAVLIRKNSLFYKTEHGAAVGDILLSLIETCRLNGVNAWQYLLTLVRCAPEVRQRPAAFLPWNYGQPVLEAGAAAKVAA
jgi:transposase